MIGAIIQARTGSSRFPQKIFAEIGGIPLLRLVVERCKLSTHIGRVVVATTCSSSDDRVVDACEKWGVSTFRGSEEDVLRRFAEAATTFDIDIVVRVTADDPFKDPDIIDRAIELLVSSPEMDYVSNTVHPTYPEGLDIEVFHRKALLQADREASLPSEREHVTPFIWKRSKDFRIFNFEADEDFSHLRWTIDYPRDLTMMNELVDLTQMSPIDVRMRDLLAVVEKHPHLASNSGVTARNEGYLRSVDEERKDVQ